MNYLAQMTAAESPNRAMPVDVAAVVYEAVTDGKRQWRYTVACDDFIAYRRSMTDEQWFEGMCKQYNGQM